MLADSPELRRSIPAAAVAPRRRPLCDARQRRHAAIPERREPDAFLE
jgi:hypothetical protein